MGQSPSRPLPPPPPIPNPNPNPPAVSTTTTIDLTSDLPDDCLALIFQSLPSSSDRSRCSLVCKRWLRVEGQSRLRLSLNADSSLSPLISPLFSRFPFVSKLALRCDRRSPSIDDDSLSSISLLCPSLSRLKLRSTRLLSDASLSSLPLRCPLLKKLSFANCDFGPTGLNSLLLHCPLLVELSVKRLRGFMPEDTDTNSIGPGLASKSLRSLCLREQYNGQLFAPLITGCRNLKTLKLIKCMGDWDRVLKSMAPDSGLVEVHLERVEVSDAGLVALSRCSGLEVLHVVKAPECTDSGVVAVAQKCRLLRKVHIDGWRTNRIGDEGLTALGRNCTNLQELVLIGVNPTIVSLEVIASNCRSLERLALCSSETIRDVEISCLANKCMALKKLCVKSCPISDNGLEALAWGCPNLVKVKVKKCKEVTRYIIELLKMRRESLVVNVDADEVEPVVEASISDGGGAQEDVLDAPQPVQGETLPPRPPLMGRSETRQTSLRSKFGSLVGRNMASCALRRWSIGSSSNSSRSKP